MDAGVFRNDLVADVETTVGDNDLMMGIYPD